MKTPEKIHAWLYRTCLMMAVLVILSACSRKKDKWVNRSFHEMTTYYNILFNGNMILDEGVEQLTAINSEDFWDVLPVEPFLNRKEAIEYGELVDLSDVYIPLGFSVERPEVEVFKQKDISTESRAQNAADKSMEKGRLEAISKAFDVFESNSRNQQGNIRATDRNLNQTNQNIQDRGQSTIQERNRSPNNDQRFSGNLPNRDSNKDRRNRGGNQSRQQNFSQSNPEEQFSTHTRAGSYYEEDDPLDGIDLDNAFAVVEDKAAKAIQKHSMVIDGEEKNRLIGQSYLLLGKARYYDQRYFPALEVFNYIMSRFYDEGDLISTAEIWREKIYLRLENNQRVAQNIPAILKGEPARDSARFSNTLKISENLFKKDFDVSGSLLKGHIEEKAAIAENLSFHSKEDLTEANSVLAQAYINLGENEKAITALSEAIQTAKDPSKKGRLLFIKAQLFEESGDISKAKIAFDEVIKLNRRIPRAMLVQAYLRKIRHFDRVEENRDNQIDTIDRLLKDRENRPYLDLINFYTAEYYQSIDSFGLAKAHYDTALDLDNSGPGLRSRTYGALGNHYFEKEAYAKAAAYYDSTMVNLPKLSRQYRDITKRRIDLNEVIVYEDVARRNDSILKLTAMSAEARLHYFQGYTDSLKAAAVAQQKQEASGKRRDSRKKLQNEMAFSGASSGNFYFYDEKQIAEGKRVFQQIWGDRSLQDDWRTQRGRLSTEREAAGEDEEESLVKDDLEGDPRFDVQTYLSAIPDDQEEIDQLNEELNFADLQLAVLYKEKFFKNKKAIKKLEKLLKNNPDHRLVLPAKYNLYRAYQDIGEIHLAEELKNSILVDHPDSRYAILLENADGHKEAMDPDRIYEQLYKKYEGQQYEEVITETEKYANRFVGNAVVPKFELLRAMAVGRLYGLDAYEESLSFVALNYPQSEAGKKASKLLLDAVPEFRNTGFDLNLNGSHKLIYPFSEDERDDAEKFSYTVERSLREYKLDEVLSVSLETFSYNKLFVVVSGFRNRLQAEGYGEKLKEEKAYAISRDRFEISSDNYKTLLIHKNLEEYLQNYKL